MSVWKPFLAVVATVLLGTLAACSRPQPGELVGVQSLVSSADRTATRVAIRTATAGAWVNIRATATVDWLPTGRRSLVRDYTEWQIAGTLVARYTATATPTATPTLTPTTAPTATATP